MGQCEQDQINCNLIKLNIENLLVKYSQEDIFRLVFKDKINLNDKYLSPFREDNNPNCFFEWYKGRLMFRDFADVRRDCVQAVKDYYGFCNYVETFQYIEEALIDKKRIHIEKAHAHAEVEFHEITTLGRKFEIRDYLFWKQFYISEEQLSEDIVYPVSRFRFYARKLRKWVVLNPFDITYAIAEFERAIKIYRPYYNNSKWITNCSNNDIGNVKNISAEYDYLIITKSYKDCRVIRNEDFSNSVWFPSEKIIPSMNVLSELINPYSVIIIFYDNDATGIEGSNVLKYKIQELYPLKQVIQIVSPLSYCKDPAAIVSIKGKDYLKSLMWKNIYLP